MDEFLNTCDWAPDHKTILAGGLPYRKYGWLMRLLMKRIVRKSGGDTDTSQNHEYTDWAQVEQFAANFTAEELFNTNEAMKSDDVCHGVGAHQ